MPAYMKEGGREWKQNRKNILYEPFPDVAFWGDHWGATLKHLTCSSPSLYTSIWSLLLWRPSPSLQWPTSVSMYLAESACSLSGVVWRHGHSFCAMWPLKTHGGLITSYTGIEDTSCLSEWCLGDWMPLETVYSCLRQALDNVGLVRTLDGNAIWIWVHYYIIKSRGSHGPNAGHSWFEGLVVYQRSYSNLVGFKNQKKTTRK